MRRRSCFTLIELLVVIAIIAILASMLLPSLNKAREKARAVTCVNNAKQLNTSMNFYVDDSDGYIPLAYQAKAGGNGKIYWASRLIVPGYLGSSGPLVCSGLKQGTYGNPGVLRSAFNSQKRQGYKFDSFTFAYTTYGVNVFLFDEEHKNTGIKRPSETIMLTGSRRADQADERGSYVISTSGASTQYSPYSRHGKGITTSWFDGHVTQQNVPALTAEAIFNTPAVHQRRHQQKRTCGQPLR